MKTIIKSTLLLAATLMFSLNIFATGFEFRDEQYIDDIPFSTEIIATNVNFDLANSEEFYFENEGYVDDIPFSEQQLFNIGIYARAVSMEFNFEEEEYIDDLPCL